MKKFAIAGAFAVVVILAVLPMIIHGYIYPNLGDDAALHLARLSHITDTAYRGAYYIPQWSQLYYGYAMLGYPLNGIAGLTGLSMNFLVMWLFPVLLICVAASYFFVVMRLVNYKAGILAVLLPFVANGLFWQFNYGTMFNIINTGVILPFIFYFFVRWWTQGKLYQLVVLGVLIVLFGVVHQSGIYILPVITIFLAAYVAYKVVKKQKFAKKQLVLTCGLLLLGVGILLSAANKSSLHSLEKGVLSAGSGAIEARVPFNYMYDIASPFVLGLAGVAVFLYKGGVTSEMKILLVLMMTMVVVLLGVMQLKTNASYDRQVFDIATLLGVMVAIVIGYRLENIGYKETVAVGGIVAVGLIFALSNWFSYKNAIHPADKMAIEYLNKQGALTFSTSPQVTQLIYEEYSGRIYKSEGGDVFVERNIPMTEKSDPKSINYDGHGVCACGYVLDKTFDDGKVVVSVYRKAE